MYLFPLWYGEPTHKLCNNWGNLQHLEIVFVFFTFNISQCTLVCQHWRCRWRRWRLAGLKFLVWRREKIVVVRPVVKQIVNLIHQHVVRIEAETIFHVWMIGHYLVFIYSFKTLILKQLDYAFHVHNTFHYLKLFKLNIFLSLTCANKTNYVKAKFVHT